MCQQGGPPTTQTSRLTFMPQLCVPLPFPHMWSPSALQHHRAVTVHLQTSGNKGIPQQGRIFNNIASIGRRQKLCIQVWRREELRVGRAGRAWDRRAYAMHIPVLHQLPLKGGEEQSLLPAHCRVTKKRNDKDGTNCKYGSQKR